MAVMKHVGLNVAADALMVACISGVKGGMILISADDPGAFASQNEQDNRIYALHANIPCFEPTSPQEAKDMVLKAFDISERLGQLVMLRTTTTIGHMFEDVELGRLSTDRRKGKFPHNEWPRFYVESHEIVVPRHQWTHEIMDELKRDVDDSPFNKLLTKGEEKLGIVASGAAYNCAREAAKILGVENEIAFLKIGISYPLPEKLIKRLLQAVDTVLIIEETEPFIEGQVKAILSETGFKTKIRGRMSGDVPWADRLDVRKVTQIIGNTMGEEYHIVEPEREKLVDEIKKKIPSRGFALCAGCPHQASLFALKRTLKKLTGKKSLTDEGAIVAADIGCYGIAGYPPIEIQETTFSMGGGCGIANGLACANTGEKIVASIGDSTFFHSGIPPLVNAVWNQHKFMLVVHDNSITAMTGEQPCPDTGMTTSGKQAPKANIEDIVKACGVRFIEIVDPYDLKATEEAYERALKHDGVSVVLARRECALRSHRKARRMGIPAKTCEVTPECTSCGLCVRFGCVAIGWNSEKKKASIDEVNCIGCGVCTQVCPVGAMRLKGR
jgi:indolepyruvate ferredoxin oxidoreductase alpha subunit